jgi:hypothetical protein
MTKTIASFTLQLIVGIAFMTGTPAIAEEDGPRPLPIHVRLMNDAHVSAEVLENAQTEMTRIYARAGLDVRWTETDSAAPALGLTVKIVPYSLAHSHVAPDVMGVALLTQTRGTMAYVFFKRVDDFARARHIELSRMLAHVMAHEVGHLLLPAGAHSHTGLMRGTWDRLQVRDAIRGELTFTGEQTQMIRAAAR